MLPAPIIDQVLANDASVRRPATPARVLAVRDGVALDRPDSLVGEEPMEIRLQRPGRDAEQVAVTMRTPGNDFELAVGFLFTEGILRHPRAVRAVRYCDLPPDEQHYNVVTVHVTDDVPAMSARRTFAATSACGVCGKASLDEVDVACEPIPPDAPVVAASTLAALPARLRASQRLFDQTGGIHAAALFRPDGTMLAVREDVGRHNAVDKLVGMAFLAGDLPLHQRLLLVSGRAGFEIVQKAAVAGIAVVCAVSAPSTLAVDAATRFGQTLVGFLRGPSFNVYAGRDRIDLER